MEVKKINGRKGSLWQNLVVYNILNTKLKTGLVLCTIQGIFMNCLKID